MTRIPSPPPREGLAGGPTTVFPRRAHLQIPSVDEHSADSLERERGESSLEEKMSASWNAAASSFGEMSLQEPRQHQEHQHAAAAPWGGPINAPSGPFSSLPFGGGGGLGGGAGPFAAAKPFSSPGPHQPSSSSSSHLAAPNSTAAAMTTHHGTSSPSVPGEAREPVVGPH